MKSDNNHIYIKSTMIHLNVYVKNLRGYKVEFRNHSNKRGDTEKPNEQGIINIYCMKKNILNSIFLLLFTVLLTSCAASLAGNMSGSAALSSNNFSYVQKNVHGMSQATYILGIGGMKREAIVNEAKVKMLANNALRDNQALANLSVDFKHSNFLGIVKTVKCYVSADIVEFK